MTILFALLSIIVGLALIFSGYRLARVILPVLGFLYGLSIGGAIIANSAHTPFLGTALGIITGLVLGIVFAALAYFYYYLAVVIMLGGLGYWAGSGFILLLGFSPGIISAIVGIVLGVVVGIIAVVSNAPRYILIALTSLAGAVASIGGVMLLFRVIPLDTFSYTTARVVISNSFWWSLSALILLAIGLVVQVNSTADYDFEEWALGNDHPAHHPPHGSTTHMAGGAV